MSKVKIHKCDVPYAYRGSARRALAAITALGYAIAIWRIPELRPAPVDAVLGIGLGIPAGLLHSRMLLAHVVSAIERYHGTTALLWIGLLTRGYFGSFGVALLYSVTPLFLMLCGLLVPVAVHQIARWPDAGQYHIAPEWVLYGLTVCWVTALRVSRWYERLPST